MAAINFSLVRQLAPAMPEWPRRGALPRAVLQLSVLALIAIISAVALTIALAVKISGNEIAEKQRMLEAALAREQSALVAFVNDYSFWDDAVDNLYGEVNREWLESNFTGEYQGYLLDGKGRTIHSWQPTGEDAGALSSDAPGIERELLARLPKSAAQANDKSTISLRILFRGQPALIAAAPVIPYTAEHPRPSGDLIYTVMIKPIDAPLVANWSHAYELENLRLEKPNIAPAEPSVVFAESGKSPIAYLSWTPGAPGLTAARQIAPALAVAAILFLTVYAFLVRSLIASQAELDARTVAAETEMQRAQQATSEVARLAEQEKAVQIRHAQQMKQSAHAAAELIESQIGALVADLRHQSDLLQTSASETSDAVRHQESAAGIALRSSAATVEAMGAIDDNVARLIEATRAIQESAVQTETAMQKTDERSSAAIAANQSLLEQLQSISSAADVIRSLAAETDMLALNAAIEAQHAGAAGTGFAVVAGEVKELARRTKEHTGHIDTRLTSVRNAAHSIATLVSVVHQLLADLKANIGQTTHAVGQHHDHADSILATGREVAIAASSSHEAVSEISDALQQLRGFANHTREVGAIVRQRAERLDDELAQIIGKLKAA